MRRRRTASPGFSAACAAAVALLAVVPSAYASRTLRVDVSASKPTVGTPIGPHFLGLSFEASALPRLARAARQGNLVGLLRSLGPGVARFGGSSVDLAVSFWRPPGSGSPAVSSPFDFLRPTTIVRRDLVRLDSLLGRSGWSALLAVPLGRYDPASAAREAVAASRTLGRSLLAIEIGNEPDAYWLGHVRPASWGYPDYVAQVRAYARAIAIAAPSVRVAGPDTTTDPSSRWWLPAFARDLRPAILTPHYYPLTACEGPPPTLPSLLSPVLASSQDETLMQLGAAGLAAHIAVRLGETNSVGCEGTAGVSDTFGAALWAVRLMLSAARAGVSGVNFHTLPESCYWRYSPICAPTATDYTEGRFRAMPEWYALLFVHQLVDEQPVHTTVSGYHAGLTVDALSGRSRSQLDYVLVNTSTAPASSYSVRLRSHNAACSMTALWLRAPSLGATSGVTLGGRRVGARGAWHPGANAAQRPVRNCTIVVRPASAVLVRVAA